MLYDKRGCVEGIGRVSVVVTESTATTKPLLFQTSLQLCRGWWGWGWGGVIVYYIKREYERVYW